MKFEPRLLRTPYEGCHADYEESEIVLLGAGYDGTSSYRPGSRFAPAALRAETLYSQEDYSPYFDRDLSDRPVHDAGDIDLPIGNKNAALEMIRLAAAEIFQDRKIPCFLGGEHLVTLPIVEAAVQHYPDLRIVQLDAHLDLMDELFGDSLSHGTVMRRAFDLLDRDGSRLYQVGIRSGNRLEWEFARANTRLFPFDERGFLKAVSELEGYPIYLTVDLDVFDPSLLPGTGTPEAGGIFFPQYIEILKALEPLNVVGCDVVELSPYLDPSHNSSIIAAKILRELLLMLPV